MTYMYQETAEKRLKKAGFQVLSADVNWQDHGGSFVRCEGDKCYTVLDTQYIERNLDGQGLHYVDQCSVDLACYSEEDLLSACAYICADLDELTSKADPSDPCEPGSDLDLLNKSADKMHELELVYACHAYGLKDQEYSEIVKNNQVPRRMAILAKEA